MSNKLTKYSFYNPEQIAQAAAELKERVGMSLAGLMRDANGNYVPNPNRPDPQTPPVLIRDANGNYGPNPDYVPAPLPPVCGECGGRGVVKHAVDFGHPDFGKIFACSNPTCEAGIEQRARLAAMGIQRTGLPAQYRTFSFATFDALTDQQKAGKVIAREAAWAWAQHGSVNIANILDFYGVDHTEQSINRTGLVLYGGLGMGKTGLAAAAIEHLVARGDLVIYIRARDLIQSVQDTYKIDSNLTRAQVEDKFIKARFLVLDEMTLENVSADRKDIMEQVLRHRHAHRLPTFITTNHTLEQFYAAWGERTADVVAEMCAWVHVGGEKLRNTNQITMKG